jgi:hypothetical protein
MKGSLSILILLFFGLRHAETGDIVAAPDAWANTQHGVTFSLRQIPAESVGAFYIGRGFTLDQIRPYMDTCVFTAVLRNDSAPGRIHYIRENWKIINDEESQTLVSTTAWLDRFKGSSIGNAALIAFRLAQLPQEQVYETGGDWNQGMLSVNLPSGSHFDMIVHWDIQGEPYEMLLPNISCE